MKWLIFADQAALDAVLPLPSGILIPEPRRAADGRCAAQHPWPEEDIIYLTDKPGVTMADELPEDWGE